MQLHLMLKMTVMRQRPTEQLPRRAATHAIFASLLGSQNSGNPANMPLSIGKESNLENHRSICCYTLKMQHEVDKIVENSPLTCRFNKRKCGEIGSAEIHSQREICNMTGKL